MSDVPSNEKPTLPPRGFAAMDRELVKSIASRGGRAAHQHGTAHEFTAEEARAAGKLGGRAVHAKKRAAVTSNGGGQ